MSGAAESRVQESRAQELAARLPPLLLAAERIAATVTGGSHGRRRSGIGETFWQFRHTQPGDPAGAIDWRQSARSPGLFVRETEWAAAQSVGLWRDGSDSMAWRSGRELPEKRERAELLVLALAAMLLKGGERVALLSGALPAVSGAQALGRVARALLADPSPDLPAPGRLARNGEMVLVSDFLAPLEEIDSRLRALAAGGAAGHLLQVLDPAEESLPFAGRIRFSGCEDEGEVLVRRVEDLREPYRHRLAAHRDGLAAIARALGWSFAIHHTDQPPQAALLALHARLSMPRQIAGRR